MQAKTALAETPGSVFLAECTALLQQEDYEQYMNKLRGFLELVCSKCTDKGGCTRKLYPVLGFLARR